MVGSGQVDRAVRYAFGQLEDGARPVARAGLSGQKVVAGVQHFGRGRERATTRAVWRGT